MGYTPPEEDWGYIRLLYAILSEKPPEVAMSYVDKNREEILNRLFPERRDYSGYVNKFTRNI